jgi:probable F420-dependent oxidoreductase
VEDLGYGTLFLPDHLDEHLGPLVGLTVAAEATTTLRVGSLVFCNDSRHPVVLAKELATLDLLTEGRLEAGLGAGWMASDYQQLGVEFEPGAVRVERLAEAVGILKDLWRDGTCDYVGDHYRVTGAVGYPRPFRSGGPLLMIGGGGRQVLQLAARHADIVGINPRLSEGFIGPKTIASAAPSRYDERIAWVRHAAGERFATLDLQCLSFLVAVGNNRRALLDQAAAAFDLTPEAAGEAPVALVGTVGEIIDVLQARRERWGLNYWVVHETELESFAPVIARLAGT